MFSARMKLPEMQFAVLEVDRATSQWTMQSGSRLDSRDFVVRFADVNRV